MSHLSIRRAAATLPLIAVAVAFALALAGSAGARTVAKTASASCSDRAGKTVTQDGQARVFTRYLTYYACAVGSRQVRVLGGASSISGVELAGKYVAWEVNIIEPGGVLKLQNVGQATAVTVARVPNQGVAGSSAIPAYVLTDQGTIVWLLSTEHCDPVTAACMSTGTVRERSGRGSRVLTSVSKHQMAYPITALGMSADQKWVYWIVNGAVKGSQIN
jgi:hypothetical protein